MLLRSSAFTEAHYTAGSEATADPQASFPEEKDNAVHCGVFYFLQKSGTHSNGVERTCRTIATVCRISFLDACKSTGNGRNMVVAILRQAVRHRYILKAMKANDEGF